MYMKALCRGLNEAVDYCEGERADAVVHEISSDKPSENDRMLKASG